MRLLTKIFSSRSHQSNIVCPPSSLCIVSCPPPVSNHLRPVRAACPVLLDQLVLRRSALEFAGPAFSVRLLQFLCLWTRPVCPGLSGRCNPENLKKTLVEELMWSCEGLTQKGRRWAGPGCQRDLGGAQALWSPLIHQPDAGWHDFSVPLTCFRFARGLLPASAGVLLPA